MADPSHIRLRIHEDPFTERENTLHYQCAPLYCIYVHSPVTLQQCRALLLFGGIANHKCPCGTGNS